MRRLRNVRRSGTDLLTRPPTPRPPAWMSVIIDPVEQVAELADLRERGFISPYEFERERAKVLGQETAEEARWRRWRLRTWRASAQGRGTRGSTA